MMNNQQQQPQLPQQQHSRSYNSARLTIGDVVLISDPSEGIGVVRHIDELSFIIGIELTDPLGTSDGIRAGERYFKCRPKYGIFVSVSDIVRLVSPEELLHKIVVLNRALAHKHSTLSSKNKTIDKLKKEISSLTHTLQSYVMQLNELQQLQLDKNNDPLSLLDAPKKILSKELQQQIQNINTNKYHPKKPKYKHHKKLKYQQQPLSSQFNTIHSNNFNVRSLPRHNVVDVDDDGIDMLPAEAITEENSIEFDDDIMDDIDNMNRNRNRNRNHNLNTNYTMLPTQKNQTSHRESKPQTPDQNTSSDESTDDEEEDDDDDEDDTSDLSDEPHKKPRSRPPSRRGSFLNEYTHHLYDYPLNREVILHRGKQINDALYDYQQIKAKAKKKDPTHTHSNSHSHNRRKRKNKHSRDFSNEQLGFQSIHIPMSMPPMPVMPRSVSPISSHHSHSLSHHSNSSHSQSSQTQTQSHSHSHSKSKKRKSKHRKSNVEEAAKRLRKEIKAKSKQIMQQQQNMPIRPLPPKVSDDELLSDEYFVEISEKFNTSIGNTHNNVPVIPTQRLPKRFSRSQPTSPRRYENEFIFSANHNALPHNANGLPYLPKLNTSLSHNTRKHGDGKYYMDGARSAAVHDTFDNITTNNNPYQFAANNTKPLKPTSIFRKNRDAFLKRMDEKLQEAIHKFESKNGNANPTAPVASNGHNFTKFHSKPLLRKRGRSYNENSHEMQQMVRENKAYTNTNTNTNANARGSHNKSSQSTNFRKQFEWMTTQTTFSKYHDKLAMERQNKDSYDVDLVFNKQPSFAMKPRRSISLPSSPKHNKSLMTRIDSLDLGDEHEQQPNEEDEDDEDEDEEEEDVLEDVSDQSSMSDDEEEEEHDGMVEDDDLLVGDESDLYAHRHAGAARKESQPMQYDSSKFLRRKRFLRRLKNKNRYTDPSTTTSSTSTSNNNTNSDPQIYDDDMDDMDDDMEIPQANIDEDDDEEEEEEEATSTYHRKTRVKQRRKLYQYKNDSDSDDINQGHVIIDSDNEEGQHGNNANMYDNDEVDVEEDEDEDEEEDGGKNEYIDFNQEQYNYYQNKKRNSKVHLLDKDEFEKEYNSILQ